MNILVIGSGGREHAFAWKIKQSKQCDKLYVLPGNAGTEAIAENVAIDILDFPQIGNFCKNHRVELIVVGPEGPLVEGIRDFFESDQHLKTIPLVGPGKKGAQLEGSKDFSKQFMLRHGIPTAAAKTFSANQIDHAIQYAHKLSPPIVLKADGLAAGKGVVICQNSTEAEGMLKEMLLDKKFGEAGTKVLIEEFLHGIELSVFVLTDGKDCVVLPEAKDYKRIGDGDTGPNTGGMGAVSPVCFADENFMEKVIRRVINPTIEGLRKDNIPFKGFIFIGLMNCDGDPKVIEYNVRMGDPETQVVLPRIESDIVDLFFACGNGTLKNISLKLSTDYALTTVLAAGGYPDEYEKGKVISGLGAVNDATVFHAGTKRENEKTVTNGGRVLSITGKAPSLEEARIISYNGVSKIQWDDLYFRKDIGEDLLILENKH